MSTDDLDSLTDTELSDTLAALLPPPEHRWVGTNDADECAHCGLASWQDDRPCQIRWAWNTVEVMRLLRTMRHVTVYMNHGQFDRQGRSADGVTVCIDEKWDLAATAPTFERAAVLAIIRALRADTAPLP